jgi:acyl-CoA synthetase (NDP forming)/GNAT superfamily N-acetyltransferase
MTAGPASAKGAVDVVLRHGDTVRVRPLRRDDEAALVDFLEDLSDESRAFRFFSGGLSMRHAAHDAMAQALGGGYGLVAVAGEPPAIVAHAMFSPTADDAAEVAVAVADEWHGRGVATLLLAHLAAEARARGLDTFTAVVLPDNHRMIEVFRESGFAVRVRSEPHQLAVEMPTAATEDARSRFEHRDRIAAVAAVRHLLAPRSVALIGATARPGSVGAALLRNLRGSHAGPLYLIGRRAGEIAGMRVHASIADVPDTVDLAVLAVPADAVLGAARACGRAGVRTLVVVASGFEDDGGARRRAALLSVCRDFGMRLVGPNTIGVLSTASGAELNATFARTAPERGAVGLLAQSGGLLVSALEQGRSHGVGLSAAVSIGDRADISSNDLLQWWEQDPATRVIALYLESFGNPRTFAQIARRVALVKPIVAVKAGTSAAGASAAASHTGSLVAESGRATEALFGHAGIIRTDSFRELLDVAALLESQPLPLGRRVGIVTNAGGPAILCADACDAAGLALPSLAAGTRRALRAVLSDAAAVRNPVDILGDAPPARFAAAVAAVAADPGIDALIVICAPTFAVEPHDAVQALEEAAAQLPRPIPVVVVLLADRSPSAATAAVPVMSFPEDAARALGRAADHADWRRRPHSPAPAPAGIDADAAAAVLAEALGAGREWLGGEHLERLARAYSLPLAEAQLVAGAADAVRAAAVIGVPVAIKAVAPGLVHKTDAGAVRVDLTGDDEVRAAAEAVSAAVAGAGHELEALLVQRMAPVGTELLVGVAHDPAFGPVVACAAGGVLAELLDDVAVRIAPLDAGDADGMLRSLRVHRLLAGFRGAPPADVAAVADVIARLAALAAAHPEVREVDANPVIAGPDGAVIVDLRVRVAPAARRPWAPSLQGDGP